MTDGKTKTADILSRLRHHAENMPGRGLTAQIFSEAADEIERLRAEIADMKNIAIAFGGPHMAAWAQAHGLPKGHLYADHYDILKRCGARMDDFTRSDL